MKRKWIGVAALAAALVFPSIVNAGGIANYRFSWDNGGESSGGALVKNGTAYVPVSIVEMAGMTVQWDKAHQRAEFIGYGKNAAVRIGSKIGLVDGRLVDAGAAPFMYKDELYVPARFIVQTLEGGSVRWDAGHQLISASGLHTYAGVSETYAGNTYSIVKSTGELFVTGNNGIQKKIANLGSQLYDGVSMDFKKTNEGLLFVTILDNYGEPHINNHVFTLILKNGAVIRQSDVKYWQRYTDNVTQYGNHLLLTDGKSLRIIEDGTGNVTQTLDLVKLGGDDDTYFIEGIADDYLLIRPNRSGLLTLVDLKSGGSVKLYEKLLDADDIEYATTNDVPYKGDYLQYVNRDGPTLYFKNNSPINKDEKVYSFSLPVLTQ
ncbi:copper amine oxidase N-terminal domain-containing protein [Cohnella silvisoli]|uniref:Copper amine oxidase N-terminal domain-containing protein n=1 Tax=Cohnella silvisoli TaxID=2873699 RepID=A0ABV1L2A2_9BACL|nr:copper amine oxidase N-terminal domain-containing protein [Cohnella silvisoli]MCD9021549.1 copper amine oxidase N-terminal domain-containing protein [Cohnella silvisoli]